MAIIALNPLGSGAKLCSNVGEKVGQRGKGVSPRYNGKVQSKCNTIIKNDNHSVLTENCELLDITTHDKVDECDDQDDKHGIEYHSTFVTRNSYRLCELGENFMD
jgi:hypothetical protein